MKNGDKGGKEGRLVGRGSVLPDGEASGTVTHARTHNTYNNEMDSVLAI